MSGDSHSVLNLLYPLLDEASNLRNESVAKQIRQTIYEYETRECGEERRKGTSPTSSSALVPETNGTGNILQEVESWGLFEGTLASTTPQKAQIVAADIACSGIMPSEQYHRPATGLRRPFMAPDEIPNGKENGDDTTKELLFEGALSLTTPPKTQFIAAGIEMPSGIMLSGTHQHQPTTGVQPITAAPENIFKGKNEENNTAIRPLFHSHTLLTPAVESIGSPPLHTVTSVDVATSLMSSSLVQDTQLVGSSTTKEADESFLPASTTIPQTDGGTNSKRGGLFGASQKYKQRRRIDHSLSFQQVQGQSSVKDDLVSTAVWLSVVNKCYALSVKDDIPIACQSNDDSLTNT